MADTADIEIRILSQPRYLCVVRSAVETAARRMGMADASINLLVLAVDEAVANVMRHGYGEWQCDRPIWVRVKPDDLRGGQAVRVEIEDECGDVDPRIIQPRGNTCDPDHLTPGGLGVRIIHQTMDRVEFTRRPDGKGIRLTMVKALTGTGSAGQDQGASRPDSNPQYRGREPAPAAHAPGRINRHEPDA
jgi:anti-sigma regulatory factor (Ser/Thr protein kinase)